MPEGLNFIGNNIRSFRRSRNWTLAQLASKIEFQEGPLSRIERGGNLPSATVTYNLSQALDIPTDALFAPDPSIPNGLPNIFIKREYMRKRILKKINAEGSVETSNRLFLETVN